MVVVAGDAAFTCGISYEALNNAKSQTKRFIVVLNDNEWSIAKNVGRDRQLLEQRSRPSRPTRTCTTRRAASSKMIGGKCAVDLAHKVEEGVKNLLVPSVIFEELGLALLRADRWPRYPAAHPDL